MTTEATTRGLQKVHPQMYSYPVDHYRMLAAQPDRLIRSLLMGLPIGAVFLNSRDIMQPDRVVDGKQRIETILDFLGDRLDVAAEWFVAEDLIPADTLGAMVGYSDLTLPAQRRFRSATVATYQTKLRTEAEERELFLLINYGGVAQGETDADAVSR